MQVADKCICYDPSTFFLSHVLDCSPCLPECLTCTGADSCTSCKFPYTQTATAAGSCTCSIPLDSSGKCKPCAYNCEICLSPTNCLACSSSLVLDSGICSCPPSFALVIQRGNQSGCFSCSYGCMTCSEYSVCTACLSSMTLTE